MSRVLRTVAAALLGGGAVLFAMDATTNPSTQPIDAAELRKLYSAPPDAWPAATWDEHVPVERRVELGRVEKVVHPADNPWSREKEFLGWTLFFDTRLSGSGQFSCNSCHDPNLGWSDGRRVSIGHDGQRTSRNAPGLMNVGKVRELFWDGRASSLETQAGRPILDETEMHGDTKTILAKLNAVPEYREKFKAIFGADEIKMDHVAMAIACFERTIQSGRSPFDQFVGGKTAALSDSAIRGLHLFRTSAGCINCHSGPTFSDNEFHELGLSYYGRKLQDLGRFNVTDKNEDVARFRTPTLRNVSRTAPYMHNGLFDMKGVLNMYSAGMPTIKRKPEQADDPKFPVKDPILKRLDLSPQDMADLTEFMESLTEPRLRVSVPPIPK